jgi:hypothetical protein
MTKVAPDTSRESLHSVNRASRTASLGEASTWPEKIQRWGHTTRQLPFADLFAFGHVDVGTRHLFVLSTLPNSL